VLLIKEWIEDSLFDKDLTLPTGISFFDNLEPKAKYISLALTTKRLLKGVLSKSWHNYTAQSVYQALKIGVQVEIDIGNTNLLRQLIYNAYIETAKVGEYNTIISLNDPCIEWHNRIDSLANRITKANSQNDTLKITDEYFHKAEKYLRGLKNVR
jgi:hypothetical protein